MYASYAEISPVTVSYFLTVSGADTIETLPLEEINDLAALLDVDDEDDDADAYFAYLDARADEVYFQNSFD
jgi:hypothetical protein